jgi:phosphatidylinositol glycan class M
MYEYHSVNQNNFKHAMKFTLEFGLVSGGVFIVLAAYFYQLYGYDFLHETYFYHLTRRDNRHSCSAFFYEIYLNYETDFFNG